MNIKPHTVTTRVRYGETDKMGVVYHANYFCYFEIGRTELLRDLGLAYSELERKGTNLVVVEAGCRYYGNAVYDEEISISTEVFSMSKVRVRFNYTVVSRVDKRILATGYTTLACINSSKKAIRLPDEIISRLSNGID